MAMSTAEQLMHSTVRLECSKNDGTGLTGTGFFFNFKVSETHFVPVIVTNKHVVKGAMHGNFILTIADNNGMPSEDRHTVSFTDFESMWIKHADDDVDLAVFPIAQLYHRADKEGFKFYAPPLQESHLPSAATLENLSGVEDILMIGYPNGIWDAVNNRPIVRKGITATSPKADWNGRKEFVIDCACFPGSSGSPVLVFNEGSYTDRFGNNHIGKSRIILLGLLYAGPQHQAIGEIKEIKIPLSNNTISLSNIPNNLGFVIKSERLMEMKPAILKLAGI